MDAPRQPARRDEGSATVETALTFPLLILLVLGLLEFGMLLYAFNALKHSALVGLRAASVERTPTEAAVVELVRASAPGLDLADTAVVVRVNGGAGSFASRQPGDSLEVRVSYRYLPLLSRVVPELDVPLRTSTRGVMW